jgi:uncharacterized membrane protein
MMATQDFGTRGTRAAGLLRRLPALSRADGTRENGRGHDGADTWDRGVTRALGWFSVALGVAELAAPRQVSRMIGVRGRPMLVRALGVRELASGVAILVQRRPTGGLWSRVGGDVMDLALLGTAFKSPGANARRAAAATAAVAGVTVVDVLYSQRVTREALAKPIRIKKTITVNRSREELYRRWRDFERLPEFMSHLESVQLTGPNRSQWRAKAPAGTSIEWDAEVVEDRPNEAISWRSLGGGVQHTGSIQFRPAPGGRGTEVAVELEYQTPADTLGAAVAKLFGEEPGQQILEDLRRFKWLMETGEIPTTENQPSGPAPSRLLTGWGKGRS